MGSVLTISMIAQVINRIRTQLQLGEYLKDMIKGAQYTISSQYGSKDTGKYEKDNIKTLALIISDHFSVVTKHKRRPNKY